MKLSTEHVTDLGIMGKLLFVIVYTKSCKPFSYKATNLVCMVALHGAASHNGCRTTI